MGKRALVFLLIILLSLALGGCWNYRGLDQMDIVVGLAIDFDKQANEYKISYEIANLAESEKDGSIKGKLVESSGKTLFDAARNAKRREADRLFFGSAQVVVISQQVAREMGISGILDWFLRDGECRETMCVALSQEETASAILRNSDESKRIISFNLYDIITEDQQVTSSASYVQLYQLYNMLKTQGIDVTMPVLHKIPSDEGESHELNGTAVFKEDKLKGFLTPDESKYLLFANGQLKGGILTLSMGDAQTDDISLEISANQSRQSFTYVQGKVNVKIETDTRVAIAENQSEIDIMQQAEIRKIEAAAARMIERNIKALAEKTQSKFNADIFGFGKMIYKYDLKLWEQLSPEWNELFPTVEVEVISKVQVVNSAFIK